MVRILAELLRARAKRVLGIGQNVGDVDDCAFSERSPDDRPSPGLIGRSCSQILVELRGEKP